MYRQLGFRGISSVHGSITPIYVSVGYRCDSQRNLEYGRRGRRTNMSTVTVVIHSSLSFLPLAFAGFESWRQERYTWGRGMYMSNGTGRLNFHQVWWRRSRTRNREGLRGWRRRRGCIAD
jgi:hypothetical protein